MTECLLGDSVTQRFVFGYRLGIMSGLPQLKFIDSHKSVSHQPVGIKSEIFSLIKSTSDAFSNLEQKYRHVIRYVSAAAAATSYHTKLHLQ